MAKPERGGLAYYQMKAIVARGAIHRNLTKAKKYITIVDKWQSRLSRYEKEVARLTNEALANRPTMERRKRAFALGDQNATAPAE